MECVSFPSSGLVSAQIDFFYVLNLGTEAAPRKKAAAAASF